MKMITNLKDLTMVTPIKHHHPSSDVAVRLRPRLSIWTHTHYANLKGRNTGSLVAKLKT